MIKVFIAGHKGLVGSTIIRFLKKQKVKILTKERSELDLLDQSKVLSFFKNEKIDQVYLAAAKVGGIFANNNYPAEFIYENLMIQNNVIHSAFLGGVKKLLFLGSSCIYPKNAKQPISEKELLNGKLELTNEPYSIAKIAGIKMCESYNRQYAKKYKIDYRCIMPTNLYGPGDNYNAKNSHVIAGLINRFHFAKVKNKKTVSVWGDGSPYREFLFVDDMARASIFVMNLKKKIYETNVTSRCSHLNIGSGIEINIKTLSQSIKEVVGFKGKIKFDKKKTNGVKRKFLNTQIIRKLGWKPKMSLKKGLLLTYKDFLKHC